MAAVPEGLVAVASGAQLTVMQRRRGLGRGEDLAVTSVAVTEEQMNKRSFTATGAPHGGFLPLRCAAQRLPPDTLH